MWKDIDEFNGSYQVNELGEVRNTKTKHIRSFELTKKGYRRHKLYITINGESKIVNRLTHRLVALAFIPNPENKPQVNHINGIKTDNRVENLEWCTNRENTIHAFEIGLINIQKGEDRYNARLTEELVKEIRESYTSEKISYHKLAERYDVSDGAIESVVKRKTWKHVK